MSPTTTNADGWFHPFHRNARAHGGLHARAEAHHPPEGRDRHRGGPRRGPAGFGPMGFGGPGGPFGRFPLGGRGPKARRGDVRAAALLLLAEAPRNGYQLMQEIESRSRGLWRPSPGSMYPVLQQLEDEGLVQPAESEGRRVFALTDAGHAHVSERAEELGSPWDAVADSAGDGAADFSSLMIQVAMAARQVMHAGSVRQAAEAQEVLAETRRRLYRILAEDDSSVDEPPVQERVR